MESKLRVGIAGPVGSGKTAIIQRLCENLKDQLEIAVVTNDIYTQEDAKFLTNSKALIPERIKGVETGGCPHTAIREDCSINRIAVEELEKKFIWPIAWAWAGVSWEIPQIDLVEGFLYSWVANQLSAALRLLSLGPTKAQQLQKKSLLLIRSQASYLLQQNPKEIWISDVGAIMAQQSHIELYSRLFRS